MGPNEGPAIGCSIPFELARWFDESIGRDEAHTSTTEGTWECFQEESFEICKRRAIHELYVFIRNRLTPKAQMFIGQDRFGK